MMALLGAVGLAAALYFLVTPVKMTQTVVSGGLLEASVVTGAKAADPTASSDITFDCGSVLAEKYGEDGGGLRGSEAFPRIHWERLTAGGSTGAGGSSPAPTAPLTMSTLPAFFSFRHVAHQVDTGVGPARLFGARAGLPVFNCGPAVSDRRGSVVKFGLVGIALLVVALFVLRPSRIGEPDKAEGS